MRLVWDIDHVVLGYRQRHGDHTLFIKDAKNGKLAILFVYVDCMIIAKDNECEKHNLEENSASQFEKKDLGKLKYTLGMVVAYSKHRMFISKGKYALDVLKETRNWCVKT